jgi:uncharacterized FlaG/YvyC family protein
MLANLDIAPWAEYGIAGLVIAALLGFLWVFLKRQADHIEKQSERNEQHIREKDEAHRDERNEWRKEAEARSEKLNRSLDTLTDAIRFGGRRE